MKTAVVTGASTGIGYGIAKVLTQRGFHVFASVRSEKDAAHLTSSLRDVTPIVFDVSDEAAVRAGAALVRKALGGRCLSGLVNNAGIAIPGPILLQSVQDYRKQVEVNLIGAFTVSQAFAPLLGADRALSGQVGRIVNITSLGGKIGSPLLAGYCSAKHGLEGFSECLRRELIPYGIDVIIVGPGAVKTPIWDKARRDDTPFKGTDYAVPMQNLEDLMKGASQNGLAVDRVGDLVHHALTAVKPRVRYVLTPSYAFDWLVPRILPRRWVDRIFAKRLGLTNVR